MPVLNFTLVGTRPLMTHSTQIMQIGHPLQGPLKAAQARVSGRNAANPGIDAQMELMRLKWILSLYFDEKIGPFIPSDNLHASFIEGGRPTRDGAMIARDISMIGSDELPIEYEGPRTLDEMWNGGQSQFVDVRPVVIGKSKVLAARAIFPQWRLNGALAYIAGQKLTEETILRAMAVAGRSYGLGAYRRRFGRFEVFVNGRAVTTEGALA